MNIVALNQSGANEPQWTDVGLGGCDFRPHFDGHLRNLFTTVYPLNSRSATEEFLRAVAIEIANWVLLNRQQFGRGDRFQIIVGWPKDVRPTDRQVIKTEGDYDTLNRLIHDPELIQLREGWSELVFPRLGRAYSGCHLPLN